MSDLFKKQHTIADVVDGALDKLTDKGSLLSVQKELIRLNQFLQEERRTSSQRKESYTFVQSFGVMVSQVIVPPRNGWTFTIRQLTCIDNDPVYASAVSIFEYGNGPSSPVGYFFGGGSGTTRARNLYDSHELTLRPNSGLTCMIATAVTVTFIVRGDYVENIK